MHVQNMRSKQVHTDVQHAHLDVVHVQQPYAPQRPERRGHRARAAPRAQERHAARRAEEGGAAWLGLGLGLGLGSLGFEG